MESTAHRQREADAPDVASAKLDYKHGYFADKTFGKFTQADKKTTSFSRR